MSDFARQRQALISGFKSQVVPVPAMNVVTATVLALPVGNPMDRAGTQRSALAPYLSVYAGLRPHGDFNPATVAGTVMVLVEAGLIPYQDEDRIVGRRPRALFVPLADSISVNTATFDNILGQRALLPWPPGSLQVRISFSWNVANALGSEVDVCVAWAAVSQPAYNSLPAAEDSLDLVEGFRARGRSRRR